MSRSINNVASRARRKRILSRAKGYYGKRKSSVRLGTEAVNRAGAYAYRDRRARKREFRRLWIVRINAAANLNGISYSRFIDGLKKLNIEIDRKQLAEMAVNDAPAFAKLTEKIQTELSKAS
ncbi:MAG: 50S ribosomal protein L20 [Candidatus Krumholzibacteria bacterium]|jgi:large subunit ribosomal protein L20|nr:50S ribosomal protein L20 [Candidatus Krumholzibacteria bacterium]MDP6669174.1 50S ribosomal protein L20 [Candidatus Krumholzibacteria bacterium]MDP6797948.1 50S ribosomal protein L20 [Candidatus Krumholzibacteria bacterium]MDP7020858.1 50S ribosomal protein L20 [Candidatus Krumholzibacteria bacterium]